MGLGKYYPDLCERFEIAKYDDIRFLKDFDETLLENEILLKGLHVKCFMRKMQVFEEEARLFEEWLERVVAVRKEEHSLTLNVLVDLFENQGITTFEALYRYVSSKEDLEQVVVGKDGDSKFNVMMRDMLWAEIQRVQKTQNLRMMTVRQSYRDINESMLSADESESIAAEEQPVDSLSCKEGVDETEYYR